MTRFFVRLPALDTVEASIDFVAVHGLGVPVLHPCLAGIVGLAELVEARARELAQAAEEAARI